MINVLKGMLIAISMLVPGVSGATMMMTLKVYTPSLEFLSALSERKLVHKKMMLHLFGGALLGLIGFSPVMMFLLKHFNESIRFFFFGSILYGIWILVKQIPFDKVRAHHILYIFIGITVAMGLESIETSQFIQENPNLLIILLGGIGIAVALILPGVSTSFVLLTLGLYEPVLEALSTFNFKFIGLLIGGVLFGCLITAKVLMTLLKTHPVGTTILILGFVIGSLWEVVPSVPTALNVGVVLLGVLFMVIIERLSVKLDEKNDKIKKN